MNVLPRRVRRVIVPALLVAFLTSPVFAQGLVNPQWGPDVPGGYASTHILVKFKTAALRNVAASPHGAVQGAQKKELRPNARWESAAQRWGVTGLTPAIDRAWGNPRLAARFGLDRTFRVEVPVGTDAATMVREFAALTDVVETAELDGIGTVAGFIPNDLLFSAQWHMHNTGALAGSVEDADIDAPEAWAIHTGIDGSVRLAILDSGVDPHPDFDDRLVTGINTADPNQPDLTTDGCPHGTLVAGLAAAEGDNGIGVAGVTWGAHIVPVRVLNGCSGLESQAAAGIIWAADNEVDVINISLQYTVGTQVLEDAVDYAFAKGVLLVAAAGNGGTCEGNLAVVCFPARFENCMAVSATTFSDTLWVSSNYGAEIDVSAPGASVFSTWINEEYRFWSGTSFATPHVSGLAALVKSARPGLTNVALWNIITGSADDLGAAGWDQLFGHGRINAHQALLLAEQTIWVISSDLPDGAVDARQPSDVEGNNVDGWDRVTLTFNGNVADLGLSDFGVTSTAAAVSAPEVMQVIQESDDTVTVVLDGIIPVGEWTTITHEFTGTGVTLGYLPGDVNGDLISAPADILAVIDVLNGVLELPMWQTDIDRSNETGSPDILRVIDLLNGAGVYEPFLDRTLPE